MVPGMFEFVKSVKIVKGWIGLGTNPPARVVRPDVRFGRDRDGADEQGVMTTVSREAAQTFEQLMLDFLTHLEQARGDAQHA